MLGQEAEVSQGLKGMVPSKQQQAWLHELYVLMKARFWS